MASISESFTQADGNLANGWTNDSGLGAADPIVQVLSNKGSTNGTTANYIALKVHGLSITATSAVWQLDADISAPLIVNDGGVTLCMINTDTVTPDLSGLGFFVGNALHVQKFAANGSFTHPTNVSRPGEASAGVLANHITMTHAANGDINMYLDGAAWGFINDTTAHAGTSFYLSLSNATSPTNETTIDNIFLQDFIGNPVVRPSGLVVPSSAVRRAARW